MNIYIGAIMIMDDFSCYRGIEITSTILVEHISLFTSNDLSNYGTINNMRKSGFGEIQPKTEYYTTCARLLTYQITNQRQNQLQNN